MSALLDTVESLFATCEHLEQSGADVETMRDALRQLAETYNRRVAEECPTTPEGRMERAIRAVERGKPSVWAAFDYQVPINRLRMLCRARGVTIHSRGRHPDIAARANLRRAEA